MHICTLGETRTHENDLGSMGTTYRATVDPGTRNIGSRVSARPFVQLSHNDTTLPTHVQCPCAHPRQVGLTDLRQGRSRVGHQICVSRRNFKRQQTAVQQKYHVLLLYSFSGQSEAGFTLAEEGKLYRRRD